MINHHIYPPTHRHTKSYFFNEVFIYIRVLAALLADVFLAAAVVVVASTTHPTPRTHTRSPYLIDH